MNNAYRTDFDPRSADLTLASFSALSALSENAALDSYQILNDMLIPVLQSIEETMNVGKYGEEKSKTL